MAKDITFEEEAWKRIKAGVDKLANVVGSTLGPGGNTVILERLAGNQVITKDGISVARDIILEDPLENIGAMIIKEAASKTADLAGDGTTTATILAQAIFSAGVKNITAGAKRMNIKRGIDLATKAVVEELKKIAKKVEPGDVLKIATISSNGDEEIARLINESVGVVGNDGIVTVDDSRGFDSYTKKVEGLRWDRGYLSPYFVTNQEKMECEFRNCDVLIYEGRIESIKEVLPLIEKIRARDQAKGVAFPLLIIAEDVTGDALATLALNHLQQRMSVCCVNSPDYGDSRKESLKDIAALTGATIIARETGITLKTAKPDVLGQADKIRVSQWTTSIIEGKGDPEQIKGRIATIKEQMNDANPQALVMLKHRYARLTSGMVVIYVGGTTDIEIKEKKDRIDDSLQATKAALEEGIVVGGGMALIRAAANVPSWVDFEGDIEDMKIGWNLLLESLSIPLKTIASNAGESADVVYNEVKSKAGNYGFNARILKYEDLMGAGVIDPAKVTRLALENASSVAGMLLTTKAVISNVKPK